MEQGQGRLHADVDFFLKSAEGPASEEILAQLIANTVEPVARNIIRYRLGAGGAVARDAIEDVLSDTLVEALGRLRTLKSTPAADRIRDLNGFAAILAHRQCTDYFRRLHPERWRLKTRIRYLLTQHPALSVWEDSRTEFVAGLAEWTGQPAEDVNMESICESTEVHRMAAAGSLQHTVLAIFRGYGKPLSIDALVSLCARLLGIQDKPAAGQEALQDVASRRTDALSTLEQQSFLQTLWSEVRQLPQRQCMALLLSIRDPEGNSLLPLIPSAGVASLQDIAAVLDVKQDEFWELWNKVPMGDAAIAERLGMTRQQVINLRKSARERLARRLKGKS